MADDFTCMLRDKFKRFMEELPYEELRQSIFTEELEVADRLLALSERICRELCRQVVALFDGMSSHPPSTQLSLLN